MLFMVIDSARQSKPPPPASIMRKGALSSNITALPQVTNSTTSTPLSLWLVCTETLSKVKLSLKAESDYDRVISAALELLPLYADESSHLLLHCLQPDGSSRILSPLAVSALMRHVVGVDALRDGDVIVVRRGRVGGNVGARFADMTALAVAPVLDDEEALMLRETIDYLKERGYVGFKRIRGDGNCYYRAVVFGLIEQIAMHGQFLRFAVLAKIFRRVEYDDETHQRQHSRLVIFLEENAAAATTTATKGSAAGPSPAHVEQSFLLPDTDLDRAAIRACRSLVSAYMVNNADREFNGIKMKDAILPLFEHERDVVDMKSWCEKYVDRMDVDAEYHPQYGVLPHLLMAESCTIQNTEMMNHEVEQMRLDGYVEPAARPSQEQRGRSSSSASSQASSSSSEWIAAASTQRPAGLYRTESGTGTVSAFGRLHLLRRPGHYELLYHKECTPYLQTKDALLACCAEVAAAPAQSKGEGEGGWGRKRGSSEQGKGSLLLLVSFSPSFLLSLPRLTFSLLLLSLLPSLSLSLSLSYHQTQTTAPHPLLARLGPTRTAARAAATPTCTATPSMEGAGRRGDEQMTPTATRARTALRHRPISTPRTKAARSPLPEPDPPPHHHRATPRLRVSKFLFFCFSLL